MAIVEKFFFFGEVENFNSNSLYFILDIVSHWINGDIQNFNLKHTKFVWRVQATHLQYFPLM